MNAYIPGQQPPEPTVADLIMDLREDLRDGLVEVILEEVVEDFLYDLFDHDEPPPEPPYVTVLAVSDKHEDLC